MAVMSYRSDICDWQCEMEMSLETDWPDKLFGIWFDELVFDIDANDKEIPQIPNKINFEDNLPPFFFSILDL